MRGDSVGLKLLCVVAHPDDECFAFGGALLLAADRGVETHVICLTDGQAATNRGDSKSGEQLGRMRAKEFADSCKVLGVSHSELWDYQDGHLEFAEFPAIAAKLVAYMRTFRPNVVLTFAPDGSLNTHTDHAMVSFFTTAAYHCAASAKRYPTLGDPHHADYLYYQTTSYFMEDRPAPMPFPWSVTLDVRSVMERKREAFRQHTSQKPLMDRTEALFKEHGHTEYYTLAASQKPRPVTQTTDLFIDL